MTIDELKNFVGTMLNAAFPKVTIQFERIGDDPFHLGVSVYGVEANAVKWVKDRILDIDEKLCADTDFAITPLVRDEATTEKFYPQFVSPWKLVQAQSNLVLAAAESYQVVKLVEQLDSVQSDTRWEAPASICSCAANEELALAA